MPLLTLCMIIIYVIVGLTVPNADRGEPLLWAFIGTGTLSLGLHFADGWLPRVRLSWACRTAYVFCGVLNVVLGAAALLILKGGLAGTIGP
jgi:hypothetical protein